jgi:hypothetical protein
VCLLKTSIIPAAIKIQYGMTLQNPHPRPILSHPQCAVSPGGDIGIIQRTHGDLLMAEAEKPSEAARLERHWLLSNRVSEPRHQSFQGGPDVLIQGREWWMVGVRSLGTHCLVKCGLLKCVPASFLTLGIVGARAGRDG